MQITIDSRLEEVREAGRRAHAFCLESGLSPEDAFWLELAVVEALNNAVIHAYAGEPGGRVRLDLVMRDGRCEVAVTDWGRAFDFAARLAEARRKGDAADGSEGGRGLLILDQVCDRLEYTSKDGANTMRLIRNRSVA